jgi:shikimate dehydrogenase
MDQALERKAPILEPLIRLGLIGDNIAASQSPRLHELAGQQVGRKVTYERIVPPELGQDFDAIFAQCAAPSAGFRGVNITYPYKERAVAKVQIDDPLVRKMGAINTVTFEPDGPKGFNTDYSGFIAAYQSLRSGAPPGRVLLIGAGGVGKAVAFGLLKLGISEIAIADRDGTKAEALCETLKQIAPRLDARAGMDSDALARAVSSSSGLSGVINCSPIGMIGLGGTSLSREAMRGAQWAFDAVYTPVDTLFLHDAAAEGLAILSGYELFFHQGIDAFTHFTGKVPDAALLREAMRAPF